jgi:predicted transcriptional regulator
MVTLADVRRVPRDAWNTTMVRDIMTSADRLIVAASEEDAADAWNRLMTHDFQQLPVVHSGSFDGLLRRRDIAKWLHLQSNMNPAVG